MRHLGYLQRDGLIEARPQLKILHHDRGTASWNVKYYRLQRIQGPPTPPPTHPPLLIQVKEIHNPFHGEEGMLRFARWLRDP